jgi:D-lactate dehydrogenase
MPVVEEEVDKCVECGYCENRCPSRDFTMTPRQRIQVRRSLQRLKADNKQADFEILSRQFQFSGMDTCAVDGMCSIDCPVEINTGELIKRLRRENHSATANKFALLISKNFRIVEALVKAALYAGNGINKIAGDHSMHRFTGIIKKIIPSFPIWTKSISKPVSVKVNDIPDADIVYFATCITRMMGADKHNERNLSEVISNLCKKAGLKLFVAPNLNGHCCGQLFSSKGFVPAYTNTVNQTIVQLWQWSREGRLPVVLDVTSCTHSIQQSLPYLTEENKEYFHNLKFMDSIDFAHDYLLPRLKILNRKERISFHPVCTVYKMNLLARLKTLGNACSKEAEIPFLSGCCGMAGDRGFYYPELTHIATLNEASEVLKKDYDGYYSSGKTCEMAMFDATGKNYQSVLYLLDECS